MNNTNLTAVFHKELIQDSQILSSFCGKFIPTLVDSYYDTTTESKIDQICVQYSTKIRIYAISKSKNNEIFNKLNLLNTYSIFDKINYAEKFNSLLSPNKSLNSIILSLSSFKISIIEYDILYDNFNTIALYSIDKFILNGKIKSEQSFKIISSLTYNYITFFFDDNKLGFLRKKSNNNENKKQKTKIHAYSDTIGGNKYFLPSIYLNDLNNKYNIYKIINIYIPNKNFEIFNFENSDESDDKNEAPDKIQLYILYIESNIKTEKIENFNNFMRNKINIGLLSYNLKNNEYIDFKILFSGIDENAFDFTILEKDNMNDNTAIIFSAYNLQIINLKMKISMNYITNDDYYKLIFSKLYSEKEKYNIDKKFINSEIDLRGGGFFVLNSDYFFFSDSKGKIFFTEYKDIYNINFEQLKIDNKENNNLGAPYNKILMPYGYIFFLSSPFSDAILLNFEQDKQIYNIKDKIINYSPIINFHLVNDDLNNEIKLVFTHGYGENSYISFAYRHFLYNQIEKNPTEIYDEVDYMKGINNNDNIYTNYVLCKLKSKKLIIFQCLNNDLINISNNVEYNKDLNIINFGEIFINSDNNNIYSNQKYIILIFETEIKIYNKNFVLIATFNNNFIDQKNVLNITNTRVGENICLIYNSSEKKYFLFGLYENKIQSNSDKNNNIIEIMINQNLYIRYKELNILNNENEFIKLNMTYKMYLDKFNLLMIYRNNLLIEIYDITHYLEYKNNMIIDDNEKESNLRLLFISNHINYYPNILLNDNLNKNDLYRSDSNINIDFSNSINELFNIDNNNKDDNTNQILTLKSRLSFSIDSPDFIYFGNLGNLVILALTLKSGSLIIYTLYISEMTEDNKEIKGIGFKKQLIEKLSEFDFREFFRNSIDNLFIPFENINNKSGILFNLENNMRIIYEINGELYLLNDKKNKSNWGAFCDFNQPYSQNGFLAYENSLIKYYNLNYNYNLSNYSLLIKTEKIKRFPSLLTYTPEYINNNLFYHYILIEKEMISPNKFQYYMTIKKEHQNNLIIENKFEINEIVTECTVLDLQKVIGNNSKRYIALGITTITEDENMINHKLKLFEYDKDTNYIFQFEMEKEGFKGNITIIQNLNNLNNLNNLVLIGEGPKLNVYQFKLDEQLKFTMEKINYMYIDNKNMSITNKLLYVSKNKLLITGDIVDSFNFFYIRPNINTSNPIDLHTESKDNNHIHITSCDFWSTHNNKKCCIVFDEENNGYIYSLETNYILRICDFKINKIVNEIRTRGQNDSNSPTYYSSNNGSIGLILHLDNDIYEKLNYLCEFIYYHFPFNSGVNPLSFYSINYINDDKNNFQKSKGRFIDKNILDLFLKLSDKFQDAICNNVLNIDKKEIINLINDLIYC